MGMDPNLSFEEPIRVAVVGPLDFIQGVQWDLNKRSTRKFELFQWRIGESSWSANTDGFVFFVERGAQIPIQILKNIAPPSAIAVFESMNPQQVTSLGQVAAWRMLNWEEGRFDIVGKYLFEDLSKKSHSMNEGKVLSHLKSWLKENSDFPSRLIWTNSPATWKGPVEIALSSSGAPLIVGSLDSAADFKLPLSGKGEWALLQKTKHGLQFRSMLPQLPIQFFGDPSQLKVGDRLKIFDFTFEFSGSSEWASLKSFLRKSGHSIEALPTMGGNKTLADTIREYIESGASGELVVKSENRVGYISIQDGMLEEATVGPVSGLKALFRILSWPAPQSQFERFERSMVFPMPIHLGPLEFQKAYDRWKQKVAFVKEYWPSHQLKLSPRPATYLEKKSWNSKDFLVFSALCESDRVYEVLNNCQLLDVEIVESMIALRKEGLIAIR
jgi:hypothetical protein